jgi:hypothetical protein
MTEQDLEFFLQRGISLARGGNDAISLYESRNEHEPDGDDGNYDAAVEEADRMLRHVLGREAIYARQLAKAIPEEREALRAAADCIEDEDLCGATDLLREVAERVSPADLLEPRRSRVDYQFQRLRALEDTFYPRPTPQYD